ncbi:hypothetical protein [Anianabacter salinae]|uniref:hypothetical protein n=1 Tax=Anianabacter salinae TaxID=2851023 RepID=UPI00225E3C54|nr:hypothetical protein [Anianabacter salinae]MBV0911437.1 hypothetical protein [Anianabacter salinae]
MRNLLIFMALLVVLPSCSRVTNAVSGDAPTTFEGIRFKSKLSASSDDRRAFTVNVTPFTVNPRAALESGRYEATKYCLREYGGSDTDWTVGPDADPAGFQPVNDTVVLSGRCTQS